MKKKENEKVQAFVHRWEKGNRLKIECKRERERERERKREREKKKKYTMV